MVKKVTFYWIVLTLMLVDSWLLSKPNILGKIGLIIYKYHYLRSFPRTLLTVWIVVSISVLIVLLVQFLVKQEKLSRAIATVVLGACVAASLLIVVKVYIDFTSWSYSHAGLKFRYGAYLLPTILTVIFANGLFQIHWKARPTLQLSDVSSANVLQPQEAAGSVSHDTSLP